MDDDSYLTSSISSSILISSSSSSKLQSVATFSWINVSFFNASTLPTPPTQSQLALVKIVILSIIFILSLIGNTATFAQMLLSSRGGYRNDIQTLFFHLCASDLLVTLSCAAAEAVWLATVQWYAGDVACRMLKFLQVFSLYLSTYVVVVISVDRCFVILYPLKRSVAPRRVTAMVLVSWTLSGLFSLPQLLIFRVKRGPFSEEFHQCVDHGAYEADWQRKLYTITSIFLLFLLPLITMVTCYALIFWKIAKKSRNFHQGSKESPEQRNILFGNCNGQLFKRAKVTSLRMSAVIVAAFIICWSPYHVMFTIKTFCPNLPHVDWIMCFGLTNSVINPLIYGAFHFRRKGAKYSVVILRQRTQTPELRSRDSRP